jgi:acid stress-induced BolA-like protein IbaG/YrbA
MDVGLLGLLAVFMCPMVFGGITMYYSQNEIHQETLNRWTRQGWKNDQ